VELSAELPLEPSSARAARALLVRFQGRLTAPTFADLRLVVTELVTNGIRHGGDRESIRLRVVLHAEVVRVEVDCAKGPTRLQVARVPEAGLGLRIVDRLARDWGVHQHDQRTAMWADIPTA
jgi:anti-sigma regulatory factor (Ser/Thr protein kinase)